MMDISPELVSLIVDSTNKAIPPIQNTNGPLLSFVTIEAADGTRGDKDFPNGTSDEDIVAVASVGGVQRFALLSSGTMQIGPDQVPVLLIHAAERGDPSGYILAQKFVPSGGASFGEPDGQIDLIQIQQNHFRYAPFQVTPDPTKNTVLLQEALVRFGKRLMSQAFRDEDPRLYTVALTALEEESEADASFSYVHAETNTHIKVTLVYRENAFLPVELVELNSDGATSDLRDELRSQILAVYQA